MLQFENLDRQKIEELLATYYKQLGFKNSKYSDYFAGKNYCILVFLTEVSLVEPAFIVSKEGFGNACAWMCVEDIQTIKID